MREMSLLRAAMLILAGAVFALAQRSAAVTESRADELVQEWCRSFFRKLLVVTPPAVIAGLEDGAIASPDQFIERVRSHFDLSRATIQTTCPADLYWRCSADLERQNREFLDIISRIMPQAGPSSDGALLAVVMPNSISHDLLSEAARFEAPLSSPESFLDTIRYVLFRYPPEQVSSLPSSLRSFIQSIYAELAASPALTESERPRLRNIAIELESPEGREGKLFCSTTRTEDGYVIRLSPLLVRSSLLIAARYDLTSFVRTSVPRLPKQGQLVLTSLRSQLLFPIAHEIGHIALQLFTSGEADEIRCDQLAQRIIRGAHLKLDLGAFESLMVASIKEGHPEIWDGMRDTGKILARLDSIRRDSR
jgi:hypothetical protein